MAPRPVQSRPKRSPARYAVLSIVTEPDRWVRALIGGPGTGEGVWYTVASKREAARLVRDLNLCYKYATELRATGETQSQGESGRKTPFLAPNSAVFA